MSKKVVVQLKSLRSIRPSREWHVHTRDVLMSQIKAQGASEARISPFAGVGAYLSDGATIFYRSTVGALFLRPAIAFAALAFLFSGTGIAAIIAQKSIPGEPLYAIKKTREQIQSALVTGPTDRAQLELDLAGSRLEELESLSAKTPNSREKDVAIKSLVDTVNNNLATATRNLDSIRTIGEPRQVATIARSVNKKAQEFEHVLIATVNAGQGGSNLDDAISKNDETKTKTLEVIVDKKDTPGFSEEEVSSQIEEKIKKTQERIERVTVSIAAVKDADAALLQKSDEAQRNLEVAKERLERKDFKSALSKVTEIDEVVRVVEQKLKQEDTSTQKSGSSVERTKVSF